MGVKIGTVILISGSFLACGLDVRGSAAAIPGQPSDVVPPAPEESARPDASTPAPPDPPDAGGEESAVMPAAVTYRVTATGGSTGAASVGASWPAASGSGVYVVAVSTKPFRSIESVSGLGLTWAPLNAQCGEDNQTGVTLWGAVGAANAGTVTATFTAAPLTAVLAVSRFEGSRAFGAVRSANTHGEGAAAVCDDDGDGSTEVKVTVAPPPGAVVYAAIAVRLRSHAPGADVVEIDERREGSGGEATGLAIVHTTRPEVSGALDSATGWAASAVELLP